MEQKMTDNDNATAEITSFNAARAERHNDNRMWTPVECLRDCIDLIEKGEIHVDRLMVLRVNLDGGECFNVGYNLANINGSTALALLEVAKALILTDMSYIPKRHPED